MRVRSTLRGTGPLFLIHEHWPCLWKRERAGVLPAEAKPSTCDVAATAGAGAGAGAPSALVSAFQTHPQATAQGVTLAQPNLKSMWVLLVPPQSASQGVE